MSEPTIVLFGTVEHPTLTVLYHYLAGRGRRRVVYLANEAFPGQPGFDYELSQDYEGGRFVFPDQAPVEFDDIVSVGLDGYYVNPPGIEAFSAQDQEYLQTESWAALIAIFAALSRRCVVANHILRRDDFNSRMAMLAYLHSKGVPIPDTCVTSDPEEAREFIGKHGGRVYYRPIAVRELPLRAWSDEDSERLARVTLCPVHFEEQVDSELVTVVRLGADFLTEPSDVELPAELLSHLGQACDGLNLHLAEIVLRKNTSGWVCSSLYPFLRPRILTDAGASEMVAEFFEEPA